MHLFQTIDDSAVYSGTSLNDILLIRDYPHHDVTSLKIFLQLYLLNIKVQQADDYFFPISIGISWVSC